MQTKKCPNCGLLNPETAIRCDCGFDFETKAVEKPFLNKNEWDQQFTPKYTDLAWIGAISAVIFALIAFCFISGIVMVVDTSKNSEILVWLCIPISPLLILFSVAFGATISVLIAERTNIRLIKSLGMRVLLVGALVGIFVGLCAVLFILGMVS